MLQPLQTHVKHSECDSNCTNIPHLPPPCARAHRGPFPMPWCRHGQLHLAAEALCTVCRQRESEVVCHVKQLQCTELRQPSRDVRALLAALQAHHVGQAILPVHGPLANGNQGYSDAPPRGRGGGVGMPGARHAVPIRWQTTQKFSITRQMQTCLE